MVKVTDSYHHGNLRTALLDAAFEAVAQRGPDALGIRDLARTVGVSPSAAYHHFQDRDHLYAAVSQLARESVARRMLAAGEEADGRPGRRTRADRAIDRLTAIGQAYLDFAAAEPELIRIAFGLCVAEPPRPDEPSAWRVLVETLDEMHDADAMPTSRRANAEVVVWSAVHGTSVLRNDGAFPEDVDRSTVDHSVIASVLAALGCAERG